MSFLKSQNQKSEEENSRQKLKIKVLEKEAISLKKNLNIITQKY